MRRSKLNVVLIVALLGIVLSELFPLETAAGGLGLGALQISPLQAYSYQVSANPDYIQEGLNTTLTVNVQAANDTAYPFRINVTGPAGASYLVNISVTTNAAGFGANSTKYWGDFPAPANTNFVGTYSVELRNATDDALLHNSSFKVGLTDRFPPRYRRNEDVNIRGSGYNVGEKVTIRIKNETSVVVYSTNKTATPEGVVIDTWRVPINATAGNYALTITNATSLGTVKLTPDTQNFSVLSVSVLAQPYRVHEGMNTTITTTLNGAAGNTNYSFKISVIDPRGRPYNASLAVNTNATGFGNNSIKYWGNFAGANTNYVGTYIVTVNETFATTDFLVSLTDKTQYRRNETVQVQATGYTPSESVTLDIKVDTLQVTGFPQTLRADDKGKVTSSWKIPLNATRGNYTVALSNATSGGTVKTPKDTQVFEVFGVLCRMQTKNLAGQSLEGVSVEAYNASTNMLFTEGTTVSTGLIWLNLDVGNYTFKTLWRGVKVGNFNESIKQDTFLDYTLNLTNVRIRVNDESGEGIPLVDLSFSYNYTIGTLPGSEAVPLKTNTSGIAEIPNVFTNVKYNLKAWRYDFPLPETPIENSTLLLPWNEIIISVPTYTALVRVLDSKGVAVSDVNILAYEWSSGTSESVSTQTSVEGSVAFSLTLGKYRLRAFDDSIMLNETTLDLIVNNLNLTFHLSTFHLDVTVWVRDYFGQPISNAKVTIERKIDDEYVTEYTGLTGSDGSEKFTSTVGGDSRISVYVGGKLVSVKTQFLSVGQSEAEFQVTEYVAILGYPISAGLFTLMIFLLALAVVVLVLTRRRLLNAFGKKRKK